MPLSEARRKQLDAIVVQMAEQDAPEADVQAIVADFKSKYENEAPATPAKAPSLGAKVAEAAMPGITQPLPATQSGVQMDVGPLGMPSYSTTGKEVPATAMTQAARRAGQVVGGLTGAAARAAGAALPGVSGLEEKTFLERMANKDAGLAMRVRKAVQQSDAPAAAKLLADLGLSVAEDPLSFLGGISVAGKAMKLNKAVQASHLKPVKAAEDVLQRASLGEGRVGANKGVVEGLPLSRTQQAALQGVPQDLDVATLARKEAEVAEKHPAIWEQLLKGQDEALKAKAGDVQAKQTFQGIRSEKISQNTVSSILDALDAHKGRLKVRYDQIEKVGNASPLQDNDFLYDAMKEMDNRGVHQSYLTEHPKDPGRLISAPRFAEKRLVYGKHTVEGARLDKELTKLPDQHVGYDVHQTEMRTESTKLPDQHVTYKKYEAREAGTDPATGQTYYEPGSAGTGRATIPGQTVEREVPHTTTERRTAVVPGQTIEKDVVVPEKYHYDSVHEVMVKVEKDHNWQDGMSLEAKKGITEARRILHENQTYTGLKNARSHLHTLKKSLFKDGKMGPGDREALDGIYKKLTAAMEQQIRLSAGEGGEMLVSTWKAADTFYAKRQEFEAIQTILGRKDPARALRDLTHSWKKENFEALQSVKSLEADGVLPAGTYKGVQNFAFNDLIEGATRNGVVDGDVLVQQVRSMPADQYNELFSGELGDDMAQLILEGVATKVAREKKYIPSNPNAAVRFLKGVGGMPAVVAFTRVGAKGYAALRLGAFMTKMAASKSPRAAADYIRQVDQKSLMAAFFKGAAGAGAAAQVGQAANMTGPESTPQE